MFYTFGQNNSGGFFTDPAQYIIVEASSPAEANTKAEFLGAYFNPESDCSCCGSRWVQAFSFSENEAPTIYGRSLEAFLEDEARGGGSACEIPAVLVSYLDGTTATY